MAEIGFKGLIVGFLLVGLFFFAMVNFAYQFAIDNGANQTIMGNADINKSFGKMELQLNESSDTAQGQRQSLESETPIFSAGFFILGSILGAGKVFTSSLIVIFDILTGPISLYLGISSTVIGVITAILLISIIFLAWRLYKLGE